MSVDLYDYYGKKIKTIPTMDTSYLRNDLIMRGFLFKEPFMPKVGDCWLEETGKLSFENQARTLEKTNTMLLYYYEYIDFNCVRLSTTVVSLKPIYE